MTNTIRQALELEGFDFDCGVIIGPDGAVPGNSHSPWLDSPLTYASVRAEWAAFMARDDEAIYFPRSRGAEVWIGRMEIEARSPRQPGAALLARLC